MPDDSPLTPSQVRDAIQRVLVHSPSHWANAVAQAEQMQSPWHSCQAFAYLGRVAPLAESGPLLERAFQRADDGEDDYRRLAVAAWPLRALVELGAHEQAARQFERVAALAPSTKPPSSQGEACLLVFQAVCTNPELGRRALGWLLSACQPAEHWRQERAVRAAVIMAVSGGLVDLTEVLPLVREERLRNNIEARIRGGETFEPRTFF